MQRMTPEQQIASYPSNVWLSQLISAVMRTLKKTFQLNCAFCHQQASPFMRNERTEEQWLSVIERMNTYGARLPDGRPPPGGHACCARSTGELRENPDGVPQPRPGKTTCRRSR